MWQAKRSNRQGNTMDPYVKLLLANEAWVKEKLALRADFFKKGLRGRSQGFCGSVAPIHVCHPKTLPDRIRASCSCTGTSQIRCPITT